MKGGDRKLIEDMLRRAGLRRTRQRARILEVLSDSGRPVSREEIAQAMGSAPPNKVTIYRVLERLAEKGLVHRAFVRERTWYFELADRCTDEQCHPHFTCTDCGDMHCLPETSLPLAKSPRAGFVISHQRVQLEGLCPKCSAAG